MPEFARTLGNRGPCTVSHLPQTPARDESQSRWDCVIQPIVPRLSRFFVECPRRKSRLRLGICPRPPRVRRGVRPMKWARSVTSGVEILRCPRCGAPAPPLAKACAGCGGILTPLRLPATKADSSSHPLTDILQRADSLVLIPEQGSINQFRVVDGAGTLLAQGARSMEGLVGLMETVVSDPVGQFLLAFRLKNAPGRPFVQYAIPYLVVVCQEMCPPDLSGDTSALSGC